MRIPDVPDSKVQEAERKVSAVLQDLERATDVEVQRIALEQVVETDPASGRPAVHQAVDITVQPRARRRWLSSGK